MKLEKMPSEAAWHHSGSRTGFEVMFAESRRGGTVIRGTTTARDAGRSWAVSYLVETDGRWRTMSGRATASVSGTDVTLQAERVEGNRWMINGEHQPELDGCIDLDFESSAVTNTLPIHRLDLPIGVTVAAPAAFVRADDLRVERLEQTYRWLETVPTGYLFDYQSSTFDFSCTLEIDWSGLVIDYPGIAHRFAP